MREITIKVPDEVADELIEKYSKPKAWKPELNEIYWTVVYGKATHYSWVDDYSDNGSWNAGLVFKTEQEAQKHLDILIAATKIKRHAAELNFVPNWNDYSQEKWSVGYNNQNKKLVLTFNRLTEYGTSKSYYKTSEIAVQAIKDLEQEYKTVFGVK